MGTPVISLPCSYGPSELIQTGYTGNLLPNRDMRPFADAILELIHNPAKQREFGANGVKWIEANFGSETIHSKWIDIIRRIRADA